MLIFQIVIMFWSNNGGRPMKKLNMTCLVLAILTLVGVTDGQAGSGPEFLQGASTYQGASLEAPQVASDPATQPWKDWIDNNKGYDVAQEDGFDSFTPEQQNDLLNYQSASQSGFQTSADQQNLLDQSSGYESDDGNLSPAELEQWKQFIAQNNISVDQLKAEPNYQSLSLSDQTTLSFYASLQQRNSGANTSQITATNSAVSSTASSTSVDPQEENLVQQWIQYYVKEKGYTGAQLARVKGFFDFSLEEQKQVLNAVTENSNTSSNWGAARERFQQGAQWASNTQIGKETGGLGREIYKDIKGDLKSGADMAAREGINRALKWFGVKSQLSTQSGQAAPGGQNSGALRRRPAEYGPQPEQPGPGSLYQPSISTGYSSQSGQAALGVFDDLPTGRTGMAPPPPASKKTPAFLQPGMQLSATSTTGYQTTPVASESDTDLLVPIRKASSLPGLPLPTRVGKEFGALSLKDREWLNHYAVIANKLKRDPSSDPKNGQGWSGIPDTGVYSKQTLMEYYNRHQ